MITLVLPTAAEMIKEMVANIKTDELEILFRMVRGYFDERIIETIESLGSKYMIKVKNIQHRLCKKTCPPIIFVNATEGNETIELITKLNT